MDYYRRGGLRCPYILHHIQMLPAISRGVTQNVLLYIEFAIQLNLWAIVSIWTRLVYANCDIQFLVPPLTSAIGIIDFIFAFYCANQPQGPVEKQVHGQLVLGARYSEPETENIVPSIVPLGQLARVLPPVWPGPFSVRFPTPMHCIAGVHARHSWFWIWQCGQVFQCFVLAHIIHLNTVHLYTSIFSVCAIICILYLHLQIYSALISIYTACMCTRAPSLTPHLAH